MKYRLFEPESLRDLGAGIFCAFGAPKAEATIVADHLVEASLMGVESHGVIRIIQYTAEYKAGRIKPGAPVTVEKETPTTAIVDGHLNFGQVCADRLTDVAIEKARQNGVSCVTSMNFGHTGRVGAWTAKIAQADMVGIATIAVPRLPGLGHFVVPWGGREGRLNPNPISWAAPTAGNPIVADISTSATAEGKIRTARAEGLQLPPNRVIDAQGRKITDPNKFYEPSMGAILPFGGELGYKAFGLAILTTVLGGALGGEDNINVGEEPVA